MGLLREIKRVGREVRDAKRFDVYKQLHVASQELGNIDSMGEQVINEEEEDQYEEEMGIQSENNE